MSLIREEGGGEQFLNIDPTSAKYRTNDRMTSQRFYTSLQHIPRISHRQVGPCTESDRAQKQEIDFRSVFRIEKTTPDKERKYDHNVRNVFSIKI